MKYRTPMIGGRFGNILYGLLSNYIQSKKDNEKYIFVHSNKIGNNFILKEFMDAFNLQDIYYPNIDNSITDKEIEFLPERFNKPTFAEFGVDFTEQQLNEFIKDVFLKNESFKRDLITDRLSVNIRGGDYLNNIHLRLYRFNFERFLDVSLSYFKNNQITTLDVYSDDMTYAQLFDNIFRKYNFTVNYQFDSSPLNDFLSLSVYKNKIIWNSTFSYWTGYISNVLFNQTNYKNIFVPKFHVLHINGTNAWQLNPKWNII